MKTILMILGTRPEAIKMAPLIHELSASIDFNVIVCSTGQHQEMLQQVLTFFEIIPDIQLDVMLPNQSLTSLTAKLLRKIDPVLDRTQPDLVIVQGDTTTVLACALAAFYKGVKVGHLEAGLRSNNKRSPFPEEINRLVAGRLADIHFAPTCEAEQNLLDEGVDPQSIHMVGNTIVDALIYAVEKIKSASPLDAPKSLSFINFDKRIILVTGHRRESFGKPFEALCLAIKTLAEQENVEIVYPVHLNPRVQETVHSILSGLPNVHLLSPLSYPELIYLMEKSFLILTDSGGIQEEAPSLKKPVLVMRDVTERMEGVNAGIAKLVGTEKDMIIKEASLLLHSSKHYHAMATEENPYGDGKSSQRIREILEYVL